MKPLKRFYKEVSVTEVDGGGWQLQLDGSVLRTPAKQPLILPGRPFADMVAEEWRGQGEHILPHAMPVMGVASLAIDIVAAERPRIINEILGYLDTDTVCYRAAGPDVLVHRQTAAWEPLVGWVEQRFGVTLETTQGVMPVPQPARARDAFGDALEAMDDFLLTALFFATKNTASCVLAMALSEGRITGEQAFAAAFLDDLYQQEQWGADEEALERRELLRRELLAAERVFGVL